MRTQEEIVKRIEEVKADDWMGTQTSDLAINLTFENVKHLLKEGVTDWEKEEPTEEKLKEKIKDYLTFAWEKANDCRGLSASRSIDHIKTWLWLISDELYNDFEAIEYEYYGKDKLIFASNVVDFDWKSVDDGVRTNG